MSVERHYFPGNNTPQGFFSYYRYILGQREANKIICIKGGPGSGKSTFMKKIGSSFQHLGEDVDYLHCSADENSLDGVVLKQRKIALIDGTSPHIIDPVTPGAVDKIINLGEFWNEEGIIANKAEILDLNEECSHWYRVSYNYLNAAKCVFRSLEDIYNRAVEYSEIYKVVADIVGRELVIYDITQRPGKERKFFASAITSGGIVNYLSSMLREMNKIYLINVPVGYSNSCFMSIIKEGLIYRGFDTETFYCSMSPEEKIDHIMVPSLNIAFVTINEYHDIEPWEIIGDDEERKEIILIDVEDYMNPVYLEKNRELIDSLLEEYEILLNKAIKGLGYAKSAHMLVESMYIPNMNFTQVGKLADKVIEEILANS